MELNCFRVNEGHLARTKVIHMIEGHSFSIIVNDIRPNSVFIPHLRKLNPSKWKTAKCFLEIRVPLIERGSTR